MENNAQNSVGATNTTTAEKKVGYEGDLQHRMKLDGYHIPAPLFIMFAEYLGYVGKTLQWVDSWCAAKQKPEPWKQKFIETEAKVVLNEVKKKYDEKRLHELYDQLHEVILKLYEDNLASMEAPN